ncbi:hypothetical protein Hanom_Chr02g00127381 [Helianthus anomalus]
MTSFLNQGLERLTNLFEEACGVNKMLEAKLKKAEVTIVDQEMIVAVKSQHYEDKFKAETQEAQITVKNRLKMAYEAKVAGFECPSWNIDAWEAKLKDLGGNRVEYPAKHETGASSKAAEVAAEEVGKVGKDPMVEVDAGAGRDGEAVVEGAAA